MSIKIMSAIFERYPHGGGQMLLALSLADHAHDDGTHIYPSVESLATKTRQSVRAVQYQLKAMRSAGWLILVNEGDGRYGQHREYRIASAWLEGADFASLHVSKNASSIAPMGAKYDKEGCNLLHPSNNHKEPSVNRQSALKQNARGTRLTDAWMLPKKFGDWALQTYPEWSPDFIRERGTKFKNHWSAMAGKAGVKTDWFATWKNFCLAEAEFIARQQRKEAPGGVKAAWWASEASILIEGAKHGLDPRAGETMHAYRARVQAAIDAKHDSSKAPPPTGERTAPPVMHAEAGASQEHEPNSNPSPSLQKTEMTAEEIAVRKQHLAQALRAAKRGEMKQGDRTGESHE